ncbi:MAG: GTP cyclohydrolase II [Alphaproteobacteria bacterium]|nr:MAG: GTP cyclohydrolase II [Alphaproteobacteria bacterium]
MTSTRKEDPTSARMRRIDRFLVDIRRGVPVVIENSDGSGLLALAAEMASRTALSGFTALPQTHNTRVLITPKRAETLKIHRYTEGAIAVDLPTERPLETIEHLADPAKDLDRAMMGPFKALRAPLPEAAPAGLKAAKLAGLLPAALIRNLEGAARPWAEAEGLLCLAASEILAAEGLIAHALTPDDTRLDLVTSAEVPLADAPDCRLIAFRPEGLFGGGPEHIAIMIGHPDPQAPALVRIHSECFTGDLLGSLKCDCGDQLRGAIREMQKAGGGIVLYLAQEGRGIGLMNKLRAYHLQDLGFDTVDANLRLGFEADERLFESAATMLRKLGVHQIRLMTNNPDKVADLKKFGINITERVPHSFPSNEHNQAYLQTKKERSGHYL